MSECVADEIVDRVVNVAVVEEDGDVEQADDRLVEPEPEEEPHEEPLWLWPPLACTVVKLPLKASVDPPEEDAELLLLAMHTGTAAGGVAAAGRMLNRSLLFSGSSADCELRLSTELQLIERVESSSA